MKSWRTTVTGVGEAVGVLIVAFILIVNGQDVPVDVTGEVSDAIGTIGLDATEQAIVGAVSVLVAISRAIGGIATRDNAVTSRMAGAE